ncbi:MAG: SufD family Fe-S cluster assembly protein [Clostridium sp.]|nr:MAG: SufD family Fe-S cluster assembly protein [Clostridium sp.]
MDEYDVKAYHGAAIGKMNEDDLFYLMSRGLTLNEAYSLVLDGILQQYLSSIEDEAIKNALEEKIHNIL